ACPILGIQSYNFDIEVIPNTTAGPDQFYCIGGLAAELNANGGTSFSWSPALGLSCTLCPDPLATPVVTTQYIVTSNIGGGCSNVDTVVVFVVPIFPMVVLPLDDTICLNQSVQLDIITNPIDGPFTYWWDDPNGDLSNDTIANPIASPTITTTYIVEVVSGSGCTRLDSVTITVSGVGPIVTVTPEDIDICLGETVQLEAQAVIAPASCLPNIAFVCGGTILNGQSGFENISSDILGPFDGSQFGSKNQYLYLASDLLADGITPGIIESVGWNILAKNSTQPYSDFNISIGCTPADTLDSNSWLATSPVFSTSNYTSVVGVNMITLDMAYSWDGIGNIVLEVCWSNSTQTAADDVEASNKSYFATVNNVGSFMGSACGLSSPASGYTQLPNIYLSLCQQAPSVSIYEWTPTTNLSDSTISNPVAAPVTTTSYLVTVTDSISGCAGSATANINVGPNYTLTTTADTGICLGDSITISTVPSLVGTYTYLWSPPIFISDTTISNPEVYPDDTVMYHVDISNGLCNKEDSVEVLVSGVPITASSDPDAICVGTQTVQLNVNAGTSLSCGTSVVPCVGGNPYDLGSGVLSNTSSGYPAPYGNFYQSARHQMLYTAAELNAQGVVAGKITRLGFNIGTISGTTIYKNFQIKISCTGAPSLSTWISGLSTVFSPQSVNITTGWNIYAFDTFYDWDGVSNLVVEVCFDNNPDAFTTNSSTFYTTTGFTSVVYYRVDAISACPSSLTTATSFNRPNTRFIVCYPDTSLPLGYTFAWSPNVGLSDSTLRNPTATLSGPATYSVAVTDLNGCVYNHDVSITQNIVTASIVDSGNVTCAGPNTGYATGRLSGGIAPFTYLWNDPSAQTDSTAINLAAGSYKVLITDAIGCLDSATVTLVSPAGPLAGAYTIGGVTPDYVNFTAAVDDLNTRGISASVTFNVRSGTYTEQIEIDSVCGANNTAGVVFQSEVVDSTAVTLSFSANFTNNYTVRLNNAHHISFKYLTLAATNSTDARVFATRNGSSNNFIVRNIINGVTATTSSSAKALIFMELGPAKNNNISNNVLNSGSHAIYTITVETGMKITKNELNNQFYMGLWLQNKNNIVVDKNKIQSNTSGTYYGIYLNNCDSAMRTTSNKISNSGTAGYGIYLASNDGTSVEPGLIANNFIQMGATSTGYGIYFSTSACTYLDISHNSIHITSTSLSLARPLFTSSAGSNINVRNNILANSGGGYAVYITTAAVVAGMNNNDLYTSGVTLGFQAASTYTNLAAWQAGTGRDLNSVSVDPIFTSATDLHLNLLSPDTLQSGANLLASVPLDIDGTTRAAVPWMGAHEFDICGSVIADAGTDISLCSGNSIGIGGSPTASGGTTPYTYAWVPASTLDDSTLANPTAGPTVTTSYKLILTDAGGCSNVDSVLVTIPTPTDIWTQKADFGGVVRYGGVGFSIGGDGYLGTGNTAGNLDDFWKYDTASNTWTQLADFGGTPRRYAVGFSINGKGYIGTGYDGGDTQDFWEYNPGTNIWTQKANYGGGPVRTATGFNIGGTGYIGTGADIANRKDLWEYNPGTDIWTQKADFGGTARRASAGFSVGGKGYIGMGGDGISELQDFWEYDTLTDSWTQRATFPTTRSGTAEFSIGDRGYVGTGYDGSGGLNDFWEYDPGNDAWTQLANFTGTARWQAVGFSIGDKGYIGTGSISSLKYDDFYEYGPALSAGAGRNDTVCGVVSVVLGSNSTGSGGTPPYTYTWSPSATLDDTTIANPTATPTSTTTYIVRVDDASGCSKTDTVIIVVNAGLIADAGPDVAICSGSNVTIGGSPTAIGGTSPYTYSWTPAFTLNDGTIANPTAGPLATTIYDLIVTDIVGCVDTDTVIVVIPTDGDTWVQKANYGGTARAYGVGFSIGNKGYAGTGTDGVNRKDFWEYNPSSDTWTQKADFGGTARQVAVGFSIGAKGYIGTGDDGVRKKDFWEYDTLSNAWTQKADVGGSIRAHATGFSINGKGYIGIGWNGGSNFQDFWEYDPVADTWTQKANFGGAARRNATGFSI
ncbi:MAG: right-handed parallel beta-helix repeat-containing protein, partial [Flavobacteriales bacterium]|nr:right-handed parallel beta-helix repeat-containing protein [Flavobacteriales bacterium]